MAELSKNKTLHPWRERLYRIIFESETPSGRAFDVLLIILIFASVITVMLESVDWIRDDYADVLIRIEWFFTILFTIEYIVRLSIVRRPFRYARSFFGIVDLLSIIPTYLSLFMGGAQALLVVRILRLLRLFRIMKMVRYIEEANVLLTAIKASRPKITVFLGVLLSVTVIVAALMYLVEGPEHGFDNIPLSMYWAIVTMTTVGFGDITPMTPIGKFIASALMILGYAIIAVPTGIVSVELSRAVRASTSTRPCSGCNEAGHDIDAAWCKYCGTKLP